MSINRTWITSIQPLQDQKIYKNVTNDNVRKAGGETALEVD